MAAAVAAGLGLASVATADTVLGPTGDVGLFISGGLAKYQVNLPGTLANGDVDLTGYASTMYTGTATLPTSFQTFCIEHKELFAPGDSFRAVISTTAVTATPGITEPGSHAILGANSVSAMPYGKNLTAGTQWLYYNVARGNIGWTVFNKQLMQDAIQYLMGDSGIGSNAYVTAAVAHFGSLAAAQAEGQLTFQPGDGLKYKVYALNMWTRSGLTLAGYTGSPAGNPMLVPDDPNTSGAEGPDYWKNFISQDQLIMQTEQGGALPLPASVWSASALLGLVVLGRVRKSLSGNA